MKERFQSTSKEAPVRKLSSEPSRTQSAELTEPMNPRPPHPHPRSLGRKYRRGRGGYVYVFILGSALFLSSIAMAVLIGARVNGRAIAADNDASKAEALAESAVDYALQSIANDPNWRSDYPGAMPVGPMALGEGTISFSIIDDVDGNLTNNATDTIRIYGTGKVRNATKIYSVHCTAISAMSCLQTAGSFGGAVLLSNATLSSSGTAYFASNTSIAASSQNFAGNFLLQTPTQAGVTLANCTGTSPTITPTTRQLPDPLHVFDSYIASATAIAVSSLPVVSGNPTMQFAVLSPANNPYGQATNAQGLYVLDCQGQAVQIANMRIVGTLILLNPGPGTGISQSNYLAPAVANYPALMVAGDFLLASSSADLADNIATGNAQTPSVNYNPPGTPYQGVSDSTYSTTYPSRIDGIVYVSGNLTVANSPVINGVLIANGTLTQTTGVLTLGGSTPAATNPPPGFGTFTVTPVGGTWQWESVR